MQAQLGKFQANLELRTSHLMEHLMCKTYEDLYPKMRELCIHDNAYTSDNKVLFFCYGLTECVNQVQQTIFDRIINQDKLWTKEQFENEKQIVLQEYDDSFNSQSEGAYSNFFRRYYNYHSPIGYRPDIENFSYNDSLNTAYNAFKTPSMIVTVNGSIEYYSEFNTSEFVANPKFGYYDTELEKVPKENQSIVALIKRNPFGIDYASKVSLLHTCMAGGLESPLYQYLREDRGLVYGVHMHSSVIGKSCIPLVMAETSTKKENALKSAYNDFFSKPMQDLITKERFDCCKQSLMYAKKIDDILSHQSVWKTVLGNYNPYTGIDEFQYDEALELAKSVYDLNDFEQIMY